MSISAIRTTVARIIAAKNQFRFSSPEYRALSEAQKAVRACNSSTELKKILEDQLDDCAHVDEAYSVIATIYSNLN